MVIDIYSMIPNKMESARLMIISPSLKPLVKYSSHLRNGLKQTMSNDHMLKTLRSFRRMQLEKEVMVLRKKSKSRQKMRF